MRYEVCRHKENNVIGSIVRDGSVVWRNGDLQGFEITKVELDPEDEDYQVEVAPGHLKWASEIDPDLIGGA